MLHLAKPEEVSIFILPVNLAGPVPVEGPVEARAREFGGVVVELILGEERARPKSVEPLQPEAALGDHDRAAVGGVAAVAGIEKRANFRPGLDGFFNHAGGELQLVGEVGDGDAGEDAERCVSAVGGEERRADGEEVGYEVGVVESHPVDDCSAPRLGVKECEIWNSGGNLPPVLGG